MTRLAAIFGIFLTGVLVALVATSRTGPEAMTAMHAERSEKIGDMLASYACFQNTKNTTVELLASGQVHLAEACNRVHESAAQNHPDYLKFIEISDPAPTAQERIARNLIGHLHSIEGADAALSAQVRVLESELALLH
jgi:hypothetical protein